MKYFIAALLCFGFTINAQTVSETSEGGAYFFNHSACITNDQQHLIENMLSENRFKLLKENKLPQRTSAVKFDWPLRLKSTLSYPSFWAISNYVDRNPSFPGQLLDYNCGKRTYDLPSGYNHAGTDIYLWPFSWNMMEENAVEIIAAAPGTILLKLDGNYDRNCAAGAVLWNAVYIQHDDGSVAWYGHMKSGSLTNKAIGQPVAAEEFLGIVGSSGNSTGPHLHFEVHNASNEVIDPWAGACNTSPSMWNNQRPYYDPAISRLMTHSAAPAFPSCPQLETTNEKTLFQRGENILFAGYFHDQLPGLTVQYTVTDATGNIFKNWTQTFDTTLTASYWYRSYTIPSAAVQGKWKFKAVMGSQDAETFFDVGTVTHTATHNSTIPRAFYNSTDQKIIIRDLTDDRISVGIYSLLGQCIYEAHKVSDISTADFPAGIYTIAFQSNGKFLTSQKISVY